MSEIGSVINLVLGQSASPVPEVGQGATRLGYSDRTPYTVTAVHSEARVSVQADQYTRTDQRGLSEDQTYRYAPDPDAVPVVLEKRANGEWRSESGALFVLGRRERYRDPSF